MKKLCVAFVGFSIFFICFFFCLKRLNFCTNQNTELVCGVSSPSCGNSQVNTSLPLTGDASPRFCLTGSKSRRQVLTTCRRESASLGPEPPFVSVPGSGLGSCRMLLRHILTSLHRQEEWTERLEGGQGAALRRLARVELVHRAVQFCWNKRGFWF